VIYGATTFGVAGILAAYVFLRRVGPYEHDDSMPPLPPG
jgi:hypothetical protein